MAEMDNDEIIEAPKVSCDEGHRCLFGIKVRRIISDMWILDGFVN